MNTVQTGLDVLVERGFKALRGRRIGLVTNHTGLDHVGRSIVDLLHEAADVKLCALFGPEHGIRGTRDEEIADGVDQATGLPVYSLYGARQKPTSGQLAGIDTLVFDIQDIGCRFYTYISTLGNVMEAARNNGISIVVLDRPNPINGITIEGPLPDEDNLSFTAFHTIPVRHGMTISEMARMFAAERYPGVDLTVIPCQGWQRTMWFDATGLTWTNPSPNMRSLTQATLYPGIGLLEMTNLSVGRGTDTPFEWVGAPYLDAPLLAAELRALDLPGVAVIPTTFTPNASKFAGEPCHALQFLILDREAFRPVEFGIALARVLRKHTRAWETDRLNVLLANRDVEHAILESAQTTELYQDAARAFEERRRPYLIY